ncbi:hypothetical protein CH63R_03873 [Colletotrichum higginsianum IMI 349063]|uniref:Uncharacterized protein n=2 Tax=Colletotrichum higginsianum (strain IMI 349063) TaxID=759273 RepID=A0A1B7YHL5_COLHI|nr:hypothetical protein CH63R_03873 [Colletotrichum higginsianum IMI 349063]OBR11577.1 hypothetical protein CH63R_03873 [Colletotrichum higginsianum IMI 349063]
MSGLPPGWEWDYDGARWFYRYKPNGHVQFHFPKEGDEFPDFVDNFAPAPELAPEEKLESQQQLKRRTTLEVDPVSKMRATGGPLNDFGMNRSGFGGPLGKDDDEDDFFFQPENFMYLGPGAYIDVSPEADEEYRDGSPKRADRGDGPESNAKNNSLLDATSERSGVSPLQSEANTPSVINSVPAAQDPTVVQEPVASLPPAEPPIFTNTQGLPVAIDTVAASPDVPLLDSVEKPRQGPEPSSVFQPPPWDPVGIMAEMATEHTAPAHIETHPDPVEMADNAVLAPIETRVAEFGIAELPERTSPSDLKPPTQSTHDLLHQTTMSDKALYGATFGTGSRPQTWSPTRAPQGSSARNTEATGDDRRPDNPPPQPAAPQQRRSTPPSAQDVPFAIKRKPSNSTARQSKYQPYVPGVTSSVTAAEMGREAPDFKHRNYSNSLSREMSLMMGPRSTIDQTSMPSVLQPPIVPPKVPINPSQPSDPYTANSVLPSMLRDGAQGPNTAMGVVPYGEPGSQGVLQHVPSVLKPARGQPQGRPQQSALPPSAPCLDPSTSRHAAPGTSLPAQPTSKPPSARVVENAVHYTAFQPGRMHQQKPQSPQATQFSAFPPPGSIPQSLSSARGPEWSLGSRPQAHRVETTPIQKPSTVQPQSSSHQDRPSARSAPPLPDFMQRPRAQSDVRQQRGSSSQTRAMQSSIPRSPPGGEMARQQSYASSEVSSLGPPTGSQSSMPLQTPSPLESGGRRSSSGFFRGGNVDSSSSNDTPGSAGQHVPTRPAGSRPASFSGPSPTTLVESLRQQASQGPYFPTVPQKHPIPVSTTDFQQASSQQLSSTSSSPASSRRHSLPSDSLAGPGAQRSSQPASLGSYEVSDQGQGQQWSGHVDDITEVAQNVPRPQSAHPPPTQTGKSLGLPPVAKSPLDPQPPYPTETDSPAVRPLSLRPARPTVIPPSQNTRGPMSPSTPIRSPGHHLHSIKEHTENPMDTVATASFPRSSRDARRSSQGSSLNLSSASAYPSSAESARGYIVEEMMNQASQQPPTAQPYFSKRPQPMSPAGLPPHPGYSPVAGNPFQQYSPINANGAPMQSVMRPGSTPPVMQHAAKDKEKGGWLSKLMKGNKHSVLQKPPPPHQLQIAQNSPDVAPPPPQLFAFNSRADPRLSIQVANKPQSPTTVANPKTTPNFDKMPFIPPNLSIPMSNQSVAPNQVNGNPHPPLNNGQVPPAQETLSLTTVSYPEPPFAAQQQQANREQVEERPANVPSVGTLLQVGQSVDNQSDSASVSTMDVSEAQAQPILKPQLVTVEKHFNASRTQQQGPSSAAVNPAQTPQRPPSPVQRHNEGTLPVNEELVVAPLFSKAQSKHAPDVAPATKGPGLQDKWAKKPVVDYSGDDWGDDPWDYQ